MASFTVAETCWAVSGRTSLAWCSTAFAPPPVDICGRPTRHSTITTIRHACLANNRPSAYGVEKHAPGCPVPTGRPGAIVFPPRLALAKYDLSAFFWWMTDGG